MAMDETKRENKMQKELNDLKIEEEIKRDSLKMSINDCTIVL